MTTAIVRGCGTRLAGGVYATVALSVAGCPIEEFIWDRREPFTVNANALGLSAIGVRVIPGNEQTPTTIWDIVGREHYPSPADFIEEARRFGISRRLPRTSDWTKFGAGAMLVLLHPHAIITNPAAYWENDIWETRGWSTAADYCPTEIGGLHCGRTKLIREHQIWRAPSGELTNGYPDLNIPAIFCPRFWWHDIIPAKDDIVNIDGDAGDKLRKIIRQRPGGITYRVLAQPEDANPIYQLGIIARFPIGKLEVIRDRSGGSHTEILDQIAKDAGISVELVDE